MVGFVLLISTQCMFCSTQVDLTSGLFYPVVRSVVCALFGAERYGSSLSAIATIEQTTQLLAPVVYSRTYKATVEVHWGAAKGPVFLVSAAFAVLSATAALATPIPDGATAQTSTQTPNPQDTTQNGARIMKLEMLPAADLRSDQQLEHHHGN